MSGRRQRLFSAILVAFLILSGLTIAGLVLEIGERRKHAGPTQKYVAERNQSNVEEKNENQDSLWEVPWFKYRPNAKLISYGQIVEINSRGFRAPEYVIPKPAGTYRILCIGGSTTVSGLTNERTYPGFVQTILRSRLKTDRIEVINGGISGLNSQGQVRTLPAYLKEDPDMVVEYCGVNDICWGLVRKWRREATLFRKLLRHSLYLTNHHNALVMPSMKEIEQDIEESILANLATLYEAFEKAGVEFVLCEFSYPNLDLCTPEERDFFDRDLKTVWQGSYLTIESYCEIMRMYNRKLEEFGRQRGLLVIPLRSHLKGGRNIYNDICHLKEGGMASKATVISNYLEPRVAAAVAAFPRAPDRLPK